MSSSRTSTSSFSHPVAHTAGCARPRSARFRSLFGLLRRQLLSCFEVVWRGASRFTNARRWVIAVVVAPQRDAAEDGDLSLAFVGVSHAIQHGAPGDERHGNA